MPYVYDPNLDDEQNQQNQLASGSGEVKLASGSGAEPAQASGGGGAGGTNKQLNTGSNFQNLDKYLSANNGQSFANQVSGKVEDTIGQAKQNQEKAATQFQQNVDQAGSNLPTQEQIQKAVQNPASADTSQYQSWMNQQYQGPKNLADSQQAWNQYWSGTNQAEAQAKALGSEGGRFALLDQYFGRPQYGQGEKSLDNLLIQNNLGNKPKELVNQATQLKAQGNERANQLQDYATQAAQKVQGSAQQAKQAVSSAIGQSRSQIEQGLVQTNAQRQAEFDRIRQGLTSGDSGILSQLGINDKQQYFNIDPTQYLKQGSTLSGYQGANPEQLAQLRALSQLSGSGENIPGSVDAAPNAYSFDLSGFQNALQGAANQYGAELQGGGDINAINQKYNVASTATNPALLGSRGNVGPGVNTVPRQIKAPDAKPDPLAKDYGNVADALTQYKKAFPWLNFG